MGLHSLPAPAGYRAHPTTGLLLDARSDSLITAGKYQMAIPTTSAEAVAQGWPAPSALLLCDEVAGNLVDEIAGLQFAPSANLPYYNRDFQGLPYAGSLWAKKAVESYAHPAAQINFSCTNAAALEVGTNDFTVSVLLRSHSTFIDGSGVNYWVFVNKGYDNGSNGWLLYSHLGVVGFGLRDPTGSTLGPDRAFNICDGAVHLLTVAVDRDGNVSFYFDDAATDSYAASRPGDLTVAEAQSILSPPIQGNVTSAMQMAWFYLHIGAAAARTGHDALWAALSSNWLGTANTYARANPLTRAIAASRVATAAAAAFPPAYAPNAAAGDNALKTGVVCEDGATFEPIGSDNFLANCALVVIDNDGPAGMRYSVRATMTGAWDPTTGAVGFYCPAGGTAIAGASNVAWWYGIMHKRATVGTTVRLALVYNGDAGGAEYFTVYSAASALDWTAIGGTATPTRAGQLRVFVEGGSANNADNCDFGEPYLIKNRATAVLAWRRVGIVAAAATATPSLSYTNVGNARYSPARGRLKLRVSSFQGTNSAVFLSFGAAAGAGALVLDYSGGVLRLRIWDDLAALVGTASCGAVDTAEHTFTVEWDAAIGKASVMEGATVLGSFAGVWTPEPNDITPLYVGSDTAGANAARCYVTLLEGFNY